MIDNRQAFLDTAKGILIIYVVAYHSIEGIMNTFKESTPELVFYSGEYLKLFIMPLFFFISGYLSKNVIARGDVSKFKYKVADLLYIYVVWSLIIYITRLLLNPYTNTNMETSEILHLFWNPLPTIWYIYALVISMLLMRLLKHQNKLVVLLFASALYAHNMLFPEHFQELIFERVSWLFIFFILGFYYFEQTKNLIVTATQKNYVVAILITLVSALFLSGTLTLYRPVLIALSFVFGFLYLALCFSFSKSNASFNVVLEKIGRISLFIYLTHFPVPAAVRKILILTDTYSAIASILISVIVAVGAGFLAEWCAKKTVIKYMFERPPFTLLRPA